MGWVVGASVGGGWDVGIVVGVAGMGVGDGRDVGIVVGVAGMSVGDGRDVGIVVGVGWEPGVGAGGLDARQATGARVRSSSTSSVLMDDVLFSILLYLHR